MSDTQIVRRYKVVAGRIPRINPSKRFMEANGFDKKNGEIISKEYIKNGKYIIEVSKS